MPDDSRCEKARERAAAVDRTLRERLDLPDCKEIKHPRCAPAEGAIEFLVLKRFESWFKGWTEVDRTWVRVPLPLSDRDAKDIILDALGAQPGIDMTITPQTFGEYMVVPMTDATHCSITMEFRPLEVEQTETFEGADDTQGEVVRVNQVVRTAGPPERIDGEVLS